jgi:DNA repair protein RecO (recombination protein O)
MISKSRAIILHVVKYSETSIIVTLYTEEYGRQAFMVNGVRSAKSKQKPVVFQPLYLLEIESYQKANRDIQRLKEYRVFPVYNSIPFDIVKSSISMYLAELMYKVISNEEADSALFDFINDSMLCFDQMEKCYTNFHLWFTINLMQYLGIQPENNFSNHNKWFDLKNGRFVSERPLTLDTPDIEESYHISKLLGLKFNQLEEFTINGIQRFRILKVINEFYRYHFDGLGELKSLKVLNEIFH